MSDHRPMAAHGKDDDAGLLQAAVRTRLDVAGADLALGSTGRLSEWQRTTVLAIADKLVRTIEDELRTILAEHPAVRANDSLHAALCSAHVSIAGPILARSNVHLDRPLVCVLLRRAEEHRRHRARGAAEGGLLLELIRDGDEAIAEQAMAILIAQSRRLDSFSEPVAARTDLSAELEHRMVWRVAAALRRYMVDRQGLVAAAADEAIVAAAEQLLAGYDEGDTLDSRAMRLARRLADSGRLSDELVERSIRDGGLALFTACLAVRNAISHASAWEILSDPRGRGPVLLMRAAGFERAHASAILLDWSQSEAEVAAQADLFETTEPSVAAEVLRLWQVNPGYREAIAEIGA